MTPQEKTLLREKLELILPDWYITDNCFILYTYNAFSISIDQLNQIRKLGFFICSINKYHDRIEI